MRAVNFYRPLAYLHGAVAGMAGATHNVKDSYFIGAQASLLPAIIFAEDSYYNDMMSACSLSSSIPTLIYYAKTALDVFDHHHHERYQNFNTFLVTYFIGSLTPLVKTFAVTLTAGLIRYAFDPVQKFDTPTIEYTQPDEVISPTYDNYIEGYSILTNHDLPMYGEYHMNYYCL